MKQKLNNPKQSNRTKKIAATVAALGAAIGVNMGEVLAGSSDLQKAESRKSAISSQKIKKPDVRSPKVERAIKKRPSTLADKALRPAPNTRPNVRANKALPKLETRPSVKIDKSSRPSVK